MIPAYPITSRRTGQLLVLDQVAAQDADDDGDEPTYSDGGRQASPRTPPRRQPRSCPPWSRCPRKSRRCRWTFSRSPPQSPRWSPPSPPPWDGGTAPSSRPVVGPRLQDTGLGTFRRLLGEGRPRLARGAGPHRPREAARWRILAPQKSLWRACFPRRRVTGTLSLSRQRISCPAIA